MDLVHRLFTIILLLFAAASHAAPPTIEWDASTLRLVAADAWYGRIIRLRSGDLVAGFSRGDGVWSSRSVDGGKTWGDMIRVAGYVHGIATNSELTELRDGRLMYLFNERDTRRSERSDDLDNGVAIAFSDDGAKTWSPSRRIEGDGPMWEPCAIERGRQLVVFFADEKPFPKSDEQQISMMTSRDGGKTWTKPVAASFREGHRDGMPVPALLAGGRVMMAIEDDGLSGTFKPAIVDLSGSEKTVGGESRQRWGALAEPLAADVYAGAPYLVALDEKHTVLSAQVAEHGGLRQMAVWVGDGDAKDFAGRSTPFAMAGGVEQLWNALLTLGAGRVLAIAGTKIDGKTGVWSIEGHLVP